MFSITLICMGKLKEKFYTEAAAEYAKRLKAYCAFQLIELPECRLPEDPSAAQIAQGLQKEAELIRAKLPEMMRQAIPNTAEHFAQKKGIARALRCGLLWVATGIACRAGHIVHDFGFPAGHAHPRQVPAWRKS